MRQPFYEVRFSMQASYAQAHDRLRRFLARDDDRIAAVAGTVVLDRGERTGRAALLLHGMASSPPQFAAVAEALYARGYNVLVPRLPRHGRRDRLSDALADLTAEELIATAQESLEITRGLGERVTVVGFSLGGLLASEIAQREPVDRVVAIAPFLGIAFFPSRFRLQFAQWVLRSRNRFYWWDPRVKERQQPEHGYPRYATHAVAHALTIAHDLFERARSQAPRAERIVLVVNARETTVNNRAILRLAQRWRARRGDGVVVARLTDLPFSHDILEPLRHPEIARRVLPRLVELIDPSNPSA